MNSVSRFLYAHMYRKLFHTYFFHLERELKGSRTVLDVGCGKRSPIRGTDFDPIAKGFYSVGVDVFRHNLLESKKLGLHDEHVLSDVRKLSFRDFSFDCVVALDVLEHLTKQEGYDLLNRMERIAKKKVIVFTPNGFLRRGAVNGNLWEIHKYGWNAEGLRKLGYKVYGEYGLKPLRGDEWKLKFRPRPFWELVSDLTQTTAYRFPNIAYQLLCTRNLDDEDGK